MIGWVAHLFRCELVMIEVGGNHEGEFGFGCWIKGELFGFDHREPTLETGWGTPCRVRFLFLTDICL